MRNDIPSGVKRYITNAKKMHIGLDQVKIDMETVINDGWSSKDVATWILDNFELFEEAWESEAGNTKKDKKYQVLGTEGNILIAKYKGRVLEVVTMTSKMIDEIETDELTKQEIKDYDERYWAFAEREKR